MPKSKIATSVVTFLITTAISAFLGAVAYYLGLSAPQAGLLSGGILALVILYFTITALFKIDKKKETYFLSKNEHEVIAGFVVFVALMIAFGLVFHRIAMDKAKEEIMVVDTKQQSEINSDSLQQLISYYQKTITALNRKTSRLETELVRYQRGEDPPSPVRTSGLIRIGGKAAYGEIHYNGEEIARTSNDGMFSFEVESKNCGTSWNCRFITGKGDNFKITITLCDVDNNIFLQSEN